jgi:hypothetical protein
VLCCTSCLRYWRTPGGVGSGGCHSHPSSWRRERLRRGRACTWSASAHSVLKAEGCEGMLVLGATWRACIQKAAVRRRRGRTGPGLPLVSPSMAKKQKCLRKLRLLLHMWACAYVGVQPGYSPMLVGRSRRAQGSHRAVDFVSCFSSCPCRLGLAARPNPIGCGIRSSHQDFLMMPCQLQC